MRATIYLSPPLVELQRASREGGLRSFSDRLSAAVARYNAICARHRPKFSEAEWNALRDALNGVWMTDDISVSPAMIAAEVMDTDRYYGLGKKWDVDAHALGKRISEMTYADGVAIAEAVEAWWSTHGA